MREIPGTIGRAAGHAPAWAWGAAFGLAAVAAAWVYTAFPEGPKYMRADCIVRVDLTYPDGFTPADIRRSNRNMHGIFGAFKAGAELPLVGPVYQPGDGRKLYFIFADACEEKFQTVAKMSLVFTSIYPEAAKLSVSRDRVEPGPDTVPFSGKHWIDGGD